MAHKGETLSQVQPPSREVERGPHLFLEIECERAMAGPARWRLAGLEQVTVGRGARRTTHAVSSRVLALEIPDGWMSSEHVVLRRCEGRWTLRDLGSKNGTLVDGRRVDQVELEDAAIIQLGHTFLRFCEEVPIEGPPVRDLDGAEGSVGPLTTLSPAFGAVVERATAVASTRVPVLLVGESGTGKEVLARAIHGLSARRGTLVAVNCGGIPPNLVEGELFGHKKGAFSGADQDRLGLVRASDGGTLFLDEIGDLPPAAQAALLRVLQEAEVLPIGAHRPQPLDLRVLAATHRDLGRLVQEGKFRHDLLARLDGVTLELPPLRERREDLPLVISLLLHKLAPERPDLRVTPAAAQALLAYRWPLNIRELEHALGGALALAGAGPIDATHLPPSVLGRATEEPPRELTADEARHRDELVALLRQHGGNMSAVARVLGKGRTQIVRWVSRYGIDVRSCGAE
ncbi:MAG TPA: sigma 54-interacting transcriptional regulator [Myxococcaceae bacterium]|nr:sigma 54-interacting transcriptional regulator [Myxococcaceae bacterium]